MRQARARRREFLRYWRWLFASFRNEAVGHWPILLSLLLYPFVSGGLLCAAECGQGHRIDTYGDAVYATWITMATVGYGDKIPETPLGKVIASIDALVGLILIGLLVSLLTRALAHPGEAPTTGVPARMRTTDRRYRKQLGGMTMQGPTDSAAELGQSWWVRAVSGVVAILFGLAALFWPGLTFATLVFLFGIYVLVAGAVQLVAMFRAMGAGQTWWTHLVLGLISIAAGIAVFLWPGLTALILVYMIGFWAIALGLMEIVAAFTAAGPTFLLLVLGALTVVFGFILIANPGLGALAYVTVIGVFALVRGVVEIVGALRTPTPARGTPS